MSKFEWNDKVWGRTRCRIERRLYSQHELDIVAGGYCSLHYHLHRANLFSVTSGKIRVVWAYAWELHHKDLTTGNTFSVDTKIPHQFQVITRLRLQLLNSKI